MQIEGLIEELRMAGVELWEDSGTIRYRAPRGVMTAERAAALRQHRDLVLASLRETATVLRPHPDRRFEPFPLSNVQAAYLLGRGSVFDYGGVGCHGYGELDRRDLDVARLAAAWNAVVSRHDMLRAVVTADGGQAVLPEVPWFDVAVTDLRRESDAAAESGLAAVRAGMDHRVFTAGTWPMFDVCVTRLPDRDVVHLSLDFLVCDFVSIQLVLGELFQRYERPDAGFAPLEISFRDYLEHSQEQRDTERFRRDRRYWLDRIDTLPPAPDLPLRPDARSAPPRFHRFATALDRDDWSALRRRSAAAGVTPSTAVLTAYAEVIAAWSGSPRFTLDLTVLNRQAVHPQVDLLVGDFTRVSLLAVGSDHPGPLRDRARAIQAQLGADLEHSAFDGVDVMRELVRSGGAREVLFPVVFTSALGVSAASDQALRPSWGISQTPQVWIDCQNFERDGRLDSNWDVRDGVLPDGVAADMFDAFADLLKEMARHDRIWSSVAPVPLPAHQERCRERVNDTAVERPEGLLHEPILTQARRTPEAVAVVCPIRGRISYRDLILRAQAIADRLVGFGCGPEKVVAIQLDKSADQIAAVLGVLIAGAAYLPIDAEQPDARRDGILDEARPVAVVTSALWAPGLSVGGWPTVLVETVGPGETARPRPDSAGPDSARSDPARSDPAGSDPAGSDPAGSDPAGSDPAGSDPDDLAYVIYTSGSTGRPKGVMVTHRSASNTVADMNRRFGIGADDTVLGLAGLGFDLSVYDIFGPLAVGGTLVLPAESRRGDPSHWLDLVSRDAVTVWNSVPAQLQMFLDHLDLADRPPPRSIRVAWLSGDWIPVALPRHARRWLPDAELVSLGGATEAAIWSIWHPIDEIPDDARSVPYGRPLANQQFHVLDQHMVARPDWVAGELYIGGAGLALGYRNDPVKTARQFVRHPVTGERLYRTGDRGRYLPDGTIEFLGRTDSQVKIRGHRIELGEVESALTACPGVAAAAVLVDGDGLHRQLVGFVQPGRAPVAADRGPDTLVAVAEAAGAELLADIDDAAYRDYFRALDEVALLVMVQTLRSVGLFDDGAGHQAVTVIERLEAPRARHRLVARWLTSLAENRFLERDDDGTLRLTRPVDPDDVAAGWARVEQAQAQAGDHTAAVDYFRVSATHLVELIRGDDALPILFPDGRLDVAEDLYADALFNRWANRVGAAAVRELVRTTAAEPTRILEIGAGTGGTTAALLGMLGDLDVEYVFTDLSPFFVEAGRERFGHHRSVSFGRFDLDDDLHAQNLEPNSFDLIVAGDVLHATLDIDHALAQVRELLRPGGWLVCLEMTRDHQQIMTSLELLNRFDETTGETTDQRRGTEQVFLTRPQWIGQLERAGADAVHAIPETETELLSELGMVVLLARFKSDRIDLRPVDLRRRLTERLPASMVPGRLEVVDALPLTANGKVDDATLRSWLSAPPTPAEPGPADRPIGTTEEAVAARWADVLGLRSVGRRQSFYAMGGDSLLAAKLAGRLIDELPQRVPVFFDQMLRQILDHPTVAEIAEFLDGGAAAATDAGSTATLERDRDTTTVLRTPAGATETLAVIGPVPGIADWDDLVVLVPDRFRTVALFEDSDNEESSEPLTVGLRRCAESLVDDEQPLTLVGLGPGARLAYELAVACAELGRPVERLVVVVSRAPSGPETLIHDYLDDIGLGGQLRPPAAGHAELSVRSRLSAVAEDEGRSVERLIAGHERYAARVARLADLEWSVYAGDAILLAPTAETAGQDPVTDWSAACLGRLEVIRRPVDAPGAWNESTLTVLSDILRRSADH